MVLFELCFLSLDPFQICFFYSLPAVSLITSILRDCGKTRKTIFVLKRFTYGVLFV